jgi:hypothetical protein
MKKDYLLNNLILINLIYIDILFYYIKILV